jgi:hypothetical protein
VNVFVALVIQRRIVNVFVALVIQRHVAPQYFYTLSHKDTIFGKKGYLT